MRSVQENPADPLGSIGPAIRPATPPAPSPAKTFETVDYLPPGLAEKPADPTPINPGVWSDDSGND